jgi:hypothetical protein
MSEPAARPAARRGALEWAFLLISFGLGAFALSGVLLWPPGGWSLFGVLPVVFFVPCLVSLAVRALLADRHEAARPILDHLVDVTQLAWASAVFVHVAGRASALHDWPRLLASGGVIVLMSTGYIRGRLAKSRAA